jgi:hypothetical protein
MILKCKTEPIQTKKGPPGHIQTKKKKKKKILCNTGIAQEHVSKLKIQVLKRVLRVIPIPFGFVPGFAFKMFFWQFGSFQRLSPTS